MNQITRSPVSSLGYNFIPQEFLPAGKDEYYLRNTQNKNGIKYRHLSAYEIEVLVRNRNTSDNWNNLLVSDAFTPEMVHNCKFYGLVRIGKLEPFYLEFNNLRRPVGLYNSTIISCDFGDNVVIDNVHYISHYIVGNEVIIVNVNELATTDYAKFGNGTLKEGESESIRIWLELCNENGGRKIIPFEGMLPGDAYLWTRYREDKILQSRFKEMTEKRHDPRRGYYGIIGDRTVIKNCKIIKDVNIGTDAYLKGANKIKNLTINSSAELTTQIGEGCELVNGIIDYGCRVFYGVKAVRFVMASNSQLKYGARLINSYLGDNSTISCCEVLNSLIFPAHEQHHNNSFLCAALLKGQTNIAAGATIGSNHNSRSADGELIAGRGFWPGLCVSLKHNSMFASFCILAKGDYPSELNVPIPFSLISNEGATDTLIIVPGYWFQYNMYALARNAWKFKDRDKRINKKQLLEFNYLAPDTINEIISSLGVMEELVGFASFAKQNGSTKHTAEEARLNGKKLLLDQDPIIDSLEITASGFENSRRKVRVHKIGKCYSMFRELVGVYLSELLLEHATRNKIKSIDELKASLKIKTALTKWQNIGGQLILDDEITKLVEKIRSGKMKSWNDVHQFYVQQGDNYSMDKLAHAIASYKIVSEIDVRKADADEIEKLLQESVSTKQTLVNCIYKSRAKDYENPYRQMVYSSEEEMTQVVGKLEDNSFIQQEQEAFANYKEEVRKMLRKLNTHATSSATRSTASTPTRKAVRSKKKVQ